MLRPYKLGFRRNQAQPVNPLAPTLKNPCPSPDPRPGNTFTPNNTSLIINIISIAHPLSEYKMEAKCQILDIWAFADS